MKIKFNVILSFLAGAKGDLDFRISDLVKNPDETDTKSL